MVWFPCGDETGVYYIIISSLPFKASWQGLKDFIREPTTGGCIDVEHVHIYPNSTDGWVKIRGREDFNRAFEYMNGATGVFDGRPLQVDGRNGWGPVMLRDEAPVHSSIRQEFYGTQEPSVSSRRPSEQNCESMVSYQSMPSQSWTTQPDMQARDQSPSSIGYSPASTVSPQIYQAPSQGSFHTAQLNYSLGSQQMVYPIATPPATPTYTQATITYGVTCLMPVTQVFPAPHLPLQPHYQYPVLEPARVVHREARKIILTKLSHSLLDKDLQILIEGAAGYKPRSKSSSSYKEYPIEELDIPRGSDGKAKGHAYAVFISEGIAQKVIDALNGRMYQRRELKVRLCKEGADATNRNPSPSREQQQQQQMYPVPAPLQQQAYSVQSTPQDLTSQMGHMYITPPRRADDRSEQKRERRDKGRSRTRDKCTGTEADDEREKSPSSKSKAGTSPMVVDGTNRRRHR